MELLKYMKNQRILVVSPHLDDETLGVGGTILKHNSEGDYVYWINVTLPEDQVKRKRRISEQKRISTFFKIKEFFQMPFISTELEGKNKQLVSSFTNLFIQIKPNVLYLPNRSDIHSDHRYIFDAAYSCTKSFRYPFINRVLMYETLSETEFAPSLIDKVFHPNVFNDISKFFDKKVEALKIYHEELMDTRAPRSLKAVKSQAHLRGSRIGCAYAEAFMLIFEKH